MARVLLIDPGHFYGHKWASIPGVKPQLAQLATYIEAQGHQAEILDLEFELGAPSDEAEIDIFLKESRTILEKRDFDVAGLTCYTSLGYLASDAVGKLIKEVSPECTMAVGGYHPTAVPEDFTYEGSPFDFLVMGDGEKPLLDMCEGRLEKKESTRTVLGEPLPLEEVPTIDWEKFNYVKEKEKGLNYKYPVHIYLSRGCPFKCSFCMEKVKGWGWRAYPVEQALAYVDEIVRVVEPYSIAICDACFGFKKEWRREFLNGLIERKYGQWFSFETRADILGKEDVSLFSKLFQGKLWGHVEFGLEHASHRMLRLMRKTENPTRYLEKFVEISDECNRLGVLHRVNLLFNTPGETKESIHECVDWMNSTMEGKRDTFGCYGPVGYMHYPGSYIAQNMPYFEKEHGAKVLHPHWWRERGEQKGLAKQVVPSHDLPIEDVEYWREAWEPTDVMLMNQLREDAYQFYSGHFMLHWQGKREIKNGA